MGDAVDLHACVPEWSRALQTRDSIRSKLPSPDLQSLASHPSPPFLHRKASGETGEQMRREDRCRNPGSASLERVGILPSDMSRVARVAGVSRGSYAVPEISRSDGSRCYSQRKENGTCISFQSSWIHSKA